MTSVPILSLSGLRFAYPSQPPVLDGLGLDVPAGVFSAIIGPNGCGKTTLLKLIAGVLLPSGGEMRLSGQRLEELESRERARRIAYVPQHTVQAFPFSALEVVLTARSLYHSRFRFENRRDRDIAMEALATIDAESLADRPVTELSGGERQLVSIARALAQNARLLLLDEPAASLDLKHRARVLSTLDRLRRKQGVTALVVTHNLQMLDAYFDEIVAIKSGGIFASGSPKDVLQDSVLAEVYGDPKTRTGQLAGRTFVWSEW